MRLIISPAKKMKTDTDSFEPRSVPSFESRTRVLMDYIKRLSFEEQKALWNCNDKIAAENHERFAEMDLTRNLTPAILSYEGIQYQYMAPDVFEEGEFDYVEENLRIISGFYGVVRPMDGVVPYRLEMQSKARAAGTKNLYEFWGDAIYKEVLDESRIIINLASKEYSKCVEKYLTDKDRYITCTFGELMGEKIVQKGVYVKIARGEMVRFLAGIHAEDPAQVKEFNLSGYSYSEEHSTDNEYVFLRSTVPGKTPAGFEAGN